MKVDFRQLDRCQRGVMSHQEGQEFVEEVERLQAVFRAARTYFREFDHLIVVDYPERSDLREALAAVDRADHAPDA